ncbi:MAG: sensor histidine kinase [Pseudomonadota bacterium]|nr:sensor histidine kinase [Pseudomonadota bacterium]
MNPTRKRSELGLLGKLVLAFLTVGTVPLLTGLTFAYVEGRTELLQTIGASFQALAQDSASRVDREIERLVQADRELARLAQDDAEVLGFLAGSPEGGRLIWPTEGPAARTHASRSWIAPAGGMDPGAGARLRSVREAEAHGSYRFRVSVPIEGRDGSRGWLHRDYGAKQVLDPLVYPIRFGDTGHMMVVDQQGTIVSCPLLVTGSRIDDPGLVQRVAVDHGGWVRADSDGHGGRKLSVIGHAPLGLVNELQPAGERWVTFVWQDSAEIFAPAHSLRWAVALAGILAMALLAVLAWYAGRRIVQPIRELRAVASRIAAGGLDQVPAIRSRDEIGDLAREIDHMRGQLRRLIGGLEQQVEAAVAEKEAAVAQLVQVEKTAAVGRMSAGIGHEINNPLYAILGTAEAVRDGADPGQCRDYARDIIKYARHIAEIVKNLAGYVRPASRHELEPVDVGERLREALALTRAALLDDQVRIDLDLRPIPPLWAKADEIQQVFLNIIRNGLQAMRNQGVLDIAAWREDERILIAIADTGPGIAEEDLDKIFDPFFTTKGPDEGEGLGLYVVRQIVRKYEGSIEVESRRGEGTRFRLTFPVYEHSP